MTLHHETHIVRTAMDGDDCLYTYEEDGSQWTVRIPLKDLNRAGSIPARRALVAQIIDAARRGPSDA